MALYMGQSNPLGFGGGTPLQGGNPPRAIQPTQGMPSPIARKTVGPGTALPPLPGSDAAMAPPNVLGAEAVRATGPSQGYDSSYLQNLATAIGGLFSNSKQGGNVMNINPLGDLSEISPNSGMEGNAPTQGLPLTWLQKALNGGGFSFAQPSQKPATPHGPVRPRPPIDRSGGSGSGGGYYWNRSREL